MCLDVIKKFSYIEGIAGDFVKSNNIKKWLC